MFAVRGGSISINDQCGCLPALPGKRCPISAALSRCSRCWDRENKERFVPAAYYPPGTMNPPPTRNQPINKKTINQPEKKDHRGHNKSVSPAASNQFWKIPKSLHIAVDFKMNVFIYQRFQMVLLFQFNNKDCCQ